MFDPETGTYIVSTERFKNEGFYRFEHTYYLKYNSEKALYLIDQLLSMDKNEENAIFLAHIYIDAIFQSAGSIYNRFRLDKPDGNRKLQNKNNVKEYEFDKNNFPLLSDTDFRNFIEHIEERGQRLIEIGQFFGTFNVVFADLDLDLKNELLTSYQNNLLDLEQKTYSILLVKDDGHTVFPKTINLIDLREEFQKIYDRSSIIWSYMQDGAFY